MRKVLSAVSQSRGQNVRDGATLPSASQQTNEDERTGAECRPVLSISLAKCSDDPRERTLWGGELGAPGGLTAHSESADTPDRGEAPWAEPTHSPVALPAGARLAPRS